MRKALVILFAILLLGLFLSPAFADEPVNPRENRLFNAGASVVLPMNAEIAPYPILPHPPQ